MNEKEKAIKIVNSLKEWGKTHFIVKDRSYARLTYNEVYLLLNLIDKQNKVIDLMSRQIYKEQKIAIHCKRQKDIEECMQYKNCVDCIKQYYFRKVG